VDDKTPIQMEPEVIEDNVSYSDKEKREIQQLWIRFWNANKKLRPSWHQDPMRYGFAKGFEAAVKYIQQIGE
jgi:uncharacterized protein YukE